MCLKAGAEEGEIAKRLTKRTVWLGHYLNQDNPVTFLNGAASVRAAGYRCNQENECSIASTNYRLLQDKIETWLDESGLSEGKLKGKVLSLVGAQKTVFQKIKGAVRQKDLPPGYRLITTTGTLSEGEDGESLFSDGDSLIEITVDALGIQTKGLDMALRVKGLYAPEVHKHEVDLIPMTPTEKLAYEKAAAEIARGEIKKQLTEGEENGE